jgi:hypothetical protein
VQYKLKKEKNMKKLLLMFLAICSFNRTIYAVEVNEAACSIDALSVASYIDEVGWGKVTSSPLIITSKERDKNRDEQFQIKSYVSGKVYHVKIYQDRKSEACIILSVVAK